MRPLISKFLRGDRFPGVLAALAAFGVYLTTLAPSIGWEEDSGELAAAFATLGIPHPTGYPVFTPLAWFFSHLPLGGRPIWRLNLLCALLCALAVYLAYRLFLFLLSDASREVFPRRATVGRKGATSATVARWAAAGGALMLAFSRGVWSTSVSIEVYAMHLVFMLATTLLFLRALAAPGRGRGWRWQVFALVLGLSFAHHLMTVMLAPAFLVLFFALNGYGLAAWRRIAAALPAFAAGLAAYLYLPLRAKQGPVMNWGDPSDWGRFWFHVTGRVYRYKMFASVGGAGDKFVDFFSNLPAVFGYLPLAAAVLGLWAMARASRRLAAFALLVFAGCLFFAFNYTFDDPNFYLNAYVAVALCAAFGLAALSGDGTSRARSLSATAAGLLLFAAPWAANHRIVDQSGNHAVEEYARNVLEPLDSGAALLTTQYAYVTAPAFYLQRVEGVRPDVLVLDAQLLKFPWYYAQIGRRFPELLAGVRPELEAFLRANARFESGSRPDSAAFAREVAPDYRELLRALLARVSRDRPLFTTPDVALPVEWGYRKTPVGLVFRRSLGEAPPQGAREFSFRPLPDNASGSEVIRAYYASGYLNQALYQGIERGDTLTGTALLRRALEVKPDFALARTWLQRTGSR